MTRPWSHNSDNAAALKCRVCTSRRICHNISRILKVHSLLVEGPKFYATGKILTVRYVASVGAVSSFIADRKAWFSVLASFHNVRKQRCLAKKTLKEAKEYIKLDILLFCGDCHAVLLCYYEVPTSPKIGLNKTFLMSLCFSSYQISAFSFYSRLTEFFSIQD